MDEELENANFMSINGAIIIENCVLYSLQTLQMIENHANWKTKVSLNMKDLKNLQLLPLIF